MSTVKQQAIRAFRNMMRGKEDVRMTQRGILGDGDGNVRLTDRKDRCYIRWQGQQQAVSSVLNLRVADIENLPVRARCTEAGNDWEVYDVDYEMLTNVGSGWGGVPVGTNPHHATHEWPDGAQGPDPVNIYPRALSMLRTFRKDSSSLTVRVAPLRYTYGGELVEFTGTDMMLYTYQPAAGLARYVVTYLDPIGNIMYAHPGATTVDSAAIVPDKPDLPDFAVPSALVKLTGSKTYLSESDFVDYRLLLDQVEPPSSWGGFGVSTEDVALTGAAGTGNAVSRSDHVHAHPVLNSGDLHPEYQTPAEHTAIGNGSPHHAAVTLAADAEILLGLSTQQLTLDSQTANTMLSGPSSGAAADPTFRAMVAADIATHAHTAVGEGGDYAWADITGFGTTAELADVDLAAESAGVSTLVARADHKHDFSEAIAPTWTGAHLFKKAADSATGFQIQDQDGNDILVVDSVNNRVGVRIAPEYILDVIGASGYVRWGNSVANAVAKGCHWIMPQYDYTAEPEGWQLMQGYSPSGSNQVLIGGGDGTRNAATSIVFYTAADVTTAIGTARMTIDSVGNVLIGGTAARANTVGTEVLNIFNGIAPVGTLTNGCSIYSAAGELYTMDAAGNATLQTPHNEKGEWIFLSKTVTGKVLEIDMERIMRALNEKFNWDFIREWQE